MSPTLEAILDKLRMPQQSVQLRSNSEGPPKPKRLPGYERPGYAQLQELPDEDILAKNFAEHLALEQDSIQPSGRNPSHTSLTSPISQAHQAESVSSFLTESSISSARSSLSDDVSRVHTTIAANLDVLSEELERTSRYIDVINHSIEQNVNAANQLSGITGLFGPGNVESRNYSADYQAPRGPEVSISERNPPVSTPTTPHRAAPPVLVHRASPLPAPVPSLPRESNIPPPPPPPPPHLYWADRPAEHIGSISAILRPEVPNQSGPSSTGVTSAIQSSQPPVAPAPSRQQIQQNESISTSSSTSLTSSTSSVGSVSQLGQERPHRNAGNVGRRRNNGESVQFFYTVHSGPAQKIESPFGPFCREPVPGDLYFYQQGAVKEDLADAQVFFFDEDLTWKDISAKYFIWRRGPIYHPLYRNYVLNLTNTNSQPSYVTENSWQKYKQKALREEKL